MTTTDETERPAEPAEKLYIIRVTPGNGPIDPELAASLERVYEASKRDPNRWHNNPAKKKAALEGLGKLLDEWEAENGAFTEEELARARASMYGEWPSSSTRARSSRPNAVTAMCCCASG